MWKIGGTWKESKLLSHSEIKVRVTFTNSRIGKVQQFMQPNYCYLLMKIKKKCLIVIVCESFRASLVKAVKPVWAVLFLMAIANFLSGIVQNYKAGYHSWLYCVILLTYRYCKGAGLLNWRMSIWIRHKEDFWKVIFFWWLNTGTACPERWWMLLPWKHWRSGWRALRNLFELKIALLIAVWPLKVLSNPNHSIILWLHMIFTYFWI